MAILPFESVPPAGPVLVSQHYAPFAGSSWRWLLILPAETLAFLVPLRFAEQTTGRGKISNHRREGMDR